MTLCSVLCEDSFWVTTDANFHLINFWKWNPTLFHKYPTAALFPLGDWIIFCRRQQKGLLIWWEMSVGFQSQWKWFGVSAFPRQTPRVQVAKRRRSNLPAKWREWVVAWQPERAPENKTRGMIGNRRGRCVERVAGIHQPAVLARSLYLRVQRLSEWGVREWHSAEWFRSACIRAAGGKWARCNPPPAF